MSEYANKFSKGTAHILFFTLVSTILGYFVKIVFAKGLEIEEVGLFYAVLGFVTMFTFIRDLGFSESLIYFIPRALVKNRRKEIKTYLLITWTIQLVFGSLFFIVIYSVSGLLSVHYFGTASSISLLIPLAGYYIINGLNEVLFRTFHAYQNFLLNKGLEFVFQVLTSISLVAIVFSKKNIALLGYAYVVCGILTFLIFFSIFINFIFKGFFKERMTDLKKTFLKMSRYAFPAMTGTIADKLFGQQTIFFLTLFGELKGVGLYAMSRPLAKLTLILFISMIVAIYPMIAELWMKKKYKVMEEHFNDLLIFSYALILPLAGSLFVYAKEVLSIFYGEKYVAATLILRLLTIYFMLQAFNALCKRFFLGTGKPKVARNVTIGSLITNTLGNILLIPLFGIVGAGVADILSSFVSSLLSIKYMHKERNRLKILWIPLFKIIVLGIGFVLLLVTIKIRIEKLTLVSIFLSTFAAGTVYLVAIILTKIITIKKIRRYLFKP